jgi:hypothetical protein
MYRNGVDDIFSDFVEANSVRSTQKWCPWYGGATGQIQREQGVNVGGVRGRESSYLDSSEIAIIGATYTHVAMARSSAAGFPGESSHMGLGMCGDVQAIDVGGTGIVEEVGFGRADEMAQLVVTGIVALVSRVFELAQQKAHRLTQQVS